jgi:hypothetical protein
VEFAATGYQLQFVSSPNKPDLGWPLEDYVAYVDKLYGNLSAAGHQAVYSQVELRTGVAYIICACFAACQACQLTRDTLSLCHLRLMYVVDDELYGNLSAARHQARRVRGRSEACE